MSNWYLQTGKDSDVVISTQIKLARNLAQFNFYIKEEEEILKLENLMQENLTQIGYGLKFLKLREIDEVNLKTLIEKGLIPKESVQNVKRTSILINDEENICIVLNAEDHLQLQVFASGLAIDEIANLGIEIDEKINELVAIAKSPKYGYLTTCPTNVGTGMNIFLVLHLPGLSKTQNVHKIIKFVRQFGVEIIKGQNPDVYKIFNERTLGITEKSIVQKLKTITEKIIEQERAARKILTENKIELEDTVFRSYGVFSNCKKISENEAEDLLSNIKLGTDLGIISELTDSKVKKLYLYIKPGNLSKYFGQELTIQEENIKRAEIIKKITKDENL